MSEISNAFARYALTASNFSPASIKAAKTFILDSLGVGIAGSKAPFNEAVYKTMKSWGSGDAAHLWGHDEKAPTASAAYLNGFQIHCMEFDCVHEQAVVHPMATIFAALSAEADGKGGVIGQQLIEAVIVAVDVAVELGVAVTSPLKFFRPATAGLFGATLGIARLRGFDEETALSAMGCALAQCAGVMQAHVEGKPTLPVQIAGAARAAVVACDLAENGLAGPVSSLEGPYGYFAMFEDEVDREAAVDRLGVTNRITEVSWKPFPTGRAAQGGIVAVQHFLNRDVTIDNLEKLVLHAPPIIPRLVDRPMIDGMSANYARLCFAYIAPIVLMRGTISLDDFSDADLNSDEIRACADTISVVTNHISDPAAFTPQTAVATLKDGRTETAQIDVLFGSPASPLSPEQHLEKFRACIGFGLSEVKAQVVADGLIDLVDNLETLTDCRKIYELAAG